MRTFVDPFRDKEERRKSRKVLDNRGLNLFGLCSQNRSRQAASPVVGALSPEVSFLFLQNDI